MTCRTVPVRGRWRRLWRQQGPREERCPGAVPCGLWCVLKLHVPQRQELVLLWAAAVIAVVPLGAPGLPPCRTQHRNHAWLLLLLLPWIHWMLVLVLLVVVRAHRAAVVETKGDKCSSAVAVAAVAALQARTRPARPPGARMVQLWTCA